MGKKALEQNLSSLGIFCQLYSKSLRLIWGSASINGVCLIARKFTVVSGNSDVVRPSALWVFSSLLETDIKSHREAGLFNG